ncbi:hypothetical protein HYFRA_00011600 [Hymenoscyphus fraxineus]|uniref:Uncharacterized protein n=1 Tax=Hymenoscyphus fraxineus TaxID=746836 RepID=A0A9N9L556_9HELO|nr:hypothetical protein HYFRA_00011600 [Hymenoscyphus fraxineus]
MTLSTNIGLRPIQRRFYTAISIRTPKPRDTGHLRQKKDGSAHKISLYGVQEFPGHTFLSHSPLAWDEIFQALYFYSTVAFDFQRSLT